MINFLAIAVFMQTQFVYAQTDSDIIFLRLIIIDSSLPMKQWRVYCFFVRVFQSYLHWKWKFAQMYTFQPGYPMSNMEEFYVQSERVEIL